MTLPEQCHGFLNPFEKNNLQELTSGRMIKARALNLKLIKKNKLSHGNSVQCVRPPFQSQPLNVLGILFPHLSLVY